MRRPNSVQVIILLIASPVATGTATTDVPLDTLARWSGPLTTTFTPASTCLSEPTSRQLWPGGYPALEIGCQGPGGNECCPKKWGQYRYFSPGVCPSGYQACTLPSTRQRHETTNICCPENYDCPTNPIYGMCRSSLNTVQTTTYTDTAGHIATATWYAVSATGIQIRFQAKDSSEVPIPTDSFKLPPPPTEEELEKERKTSGGLPTGAAAGIGVGVAVFATGFIIGTCWGRKKWMEKRQGRDSATSSVSPAQVTGDEPPPAYSKR